MKKLVLDSSVIIKWLNTTDEKDVKKADKLLLEFEKSKIDIFVPFLVKFEIPNALLKGKKMAISEAADALDALQKFPFNYKDFDYDLMVAAYQIAYDYNLTFYDSSFIALAENLSCSLITAKVKHQTKIQGIHIIPLSQY